MSKHIFEEKPPAAAPQQVGGAKALIEKQARQLLYDSRYQVKKALRGKKVPPADMLRMVKQKIESGRSDTVVKARAKQMLGVNEEYVSYIEDSASDLIAKSLYKVFVEGFKKTDPIQLDYLSELAENPDKKYKVSVYDPKSDTRYVRYATREKITQLRSKGLRVEITEYGTPRESEAKQGSQTASALGGGGRAKKDYDKDGKVESPAKEHAGAVHNAIQRKRGLPADGKDTSNVKEELVGKQKNIDANHNNKIDGEDFKILRSRRKNVSEDFIGEKIDSVDQNTRKITGKGVDNTSLVKVFPEDGQEDRAGKSVSLNRSNVFAHYETSGEVISETGYSKFLDMVNEKMNLAKADMGDVISDFGKSKKPQFKGKSKKKKQKMAIAAKLEAERKAGMREEAECGCDDEPKTDSGNMCDDDPRSKKTKIDLVKNKLRAMGLNMSYELPGATISEREMDEPGEEDWRPDVRAHNRAVGYRGSYKPYKRNPKPGTSGPGSQAKPAD